MGVQNGPVLLIQTVALAAILGLLVLLGMLALVVDMHLPVQEVLLVGQYQETQTSLGWLQEQDLGALHEHHLFF